MKIFAWVIAVILFGLCAYMTFVNWSVFINNYIRKKPFVSAVLFGGGLFGVLGLFILPVKGAWIWCWVPFMIDWGSFPVIIISIVCAIREYARDKK